MTKLVTDNCCQSAQNKASAVHAFGEGMHFALLRATHAAHEIMHIAQHASVLTHNIIKERGKDGNEGENADVDAAPHQPNNGQPQSAHLGDRNADFCMHELVIWKPDFQGVLNHTQEWLCPDLVASNQMNLQHHSRMMHISEAWIFQNIRLAGHGAAHSDKHLPAWPMTASLRCIQKHLSGRINVHLLNRTSTCCRSQMYMLTCRQLRETAHHNGQVGKHDKPPGLKESKARQQISGRLIAKGSIADNANYDIIECRDTNANGCRLPHFHSLIRRCYCVLQALSGRLVDKHKFNTGWGPHVHRVELFCNSLPLRTYLCNEQA